MKSSQWREVYKVNGKLYVWSKYREGWCRTNQFGDSNMEDNIEDKEIIKELEKLRALEEL